MEWMLESISNLPDFAQIFLFILIILGPLFSAVVSGVFAYLARKQANTAIKLQSDSDHQRSLDRSEHEKEASQLESQIEAQKEQSAKDLEDMRNKHELGLEEVKQESRDREAQAEISRTLMGLVKDQMLQTATISKQAADQNSKSALTMETTMSSVENTMGSMVSAIDKLGDKTIEAFESFNKRSILIEKSIEELPKVIAIGVQKEISTMLSDRIEGASKKYEERAITRHREMVKLLGIMTEKLAVKEAPNSDQAAS